MLPVSPECPFCIAPSVFPNIYLSRVLCAWCCLCLRIVHSWLPLRFSLTFICLVCCTLCCQCLLTVHCWLPLRFSLTFICPVSCVPNVASVSGLFILDCPFSFPKHLCVLCLLCPMLPVSLDCPFFVAPSVFSNIYLSSVLCAQCCQCLRIVHSWFPLRFFSNIYLSCVLCAHCWHCLRIVHSWLPLWFSLTFIYLII